MNNNRKDLRSKEQRKMERKRFKSIEGKIKNKNGPRKISEFHGQRKKKTNRTEEIEIKLKEEKKEHFFL